MFQMAHIGPMMGQANVFYRYLDDKIDVAINRYHKECRRLFEVLDNHLKDKQFLVNDFSIADIANWCWIRTYKWSGINFENLPHLDEVNFQNLCLTICMFLSNTSLQCQQWRNH